MSRDRRVRQPLGDQVDARVARLAARQWTVVDLDDLRACGLSKQAVSKRVKAGRLFPRHRGVFSLLPGKLPLEGLFLAAVKACGPDAVLSHFAAAVLWGLLKFNGRHPEVTAPTVRKHKGIYTHRSAHVERTYRKGIPVTPPVRTLIDVSAGRNEKQLRRATNEAFAQRLIKPHDIITTHHRGAKLLRGLLADAVPTRNEFEDAVHALLRGLPRPQVNQREGAYFPDFCWPEHGLIVEADGAQFHEHILARAYDKTRQAELESRGWRVLRVTWTEITREPTRTRARIAQALRRSAG
jgi:very-short-patch-repair endonuclease